MYKEIPLETRLEKCFKYIETKKHIDLFGLDQIDIGPIDDLPREQKLAYQHGWNAGMLMAECILETWFPEYKNQGGIE